MEAIKAGPAAPAAEPLLVRIAKLDRERVYLGLGDPVPLDQVKAGDAVFGDPAIKEKLPEGAVYVDRDCDLPAQEYRLVAPHEGHPYWHFLPVADDLTRDFEQMIELGAALALSHFNTPGTLGRYAQQFYGLASRRFPAVMQRAASKGTKR